LKDIIYSIIIPAYNEGERLRPTLSKVLAYTRRQAWNAEIIIVDDGSRDNTAQVAQEFVGQEAAVVLVRNSANRGKGYSVANGMLHARGDVLIFTDADLSSPIEEVTGLLSALTAGADIAIGSRWLRSDLQTRRQSLLRQLFGRTFNALLRVVLGLKFKDTQCGFKAFTRQAARTILPLQRIERWGFDPEILFLANKFGFRVEEVPVKWGHSEGTRLNPVADGARMFQEMMLIRCNDLTGKYDVASTADIRQAA
jgi:dolichyl-phosphate beta-glucosyltransferase